MPRLLSFFILIFYSIGSIAQEEIIGEWSFENIRNEVDVEKLAGKGELDYEHMFAYNQGGPYNNWKKKGRGEYPRSSFDWYARKWAARSIYEQEALKTVYVGTRLKRNLKHNIR